MPVSIKILGVKPRQRYAVRRVVLAARDILARDHPGLDISIVEVDDINEIQKYTPVMVAPALVIDEKLVYDLWIPSRQQVLGWLLKALGETG